MSTTTHSEQVVNHQSKSSKAQARLAWLLISPTVLVLTIVILIPIAQSLYQSLFGATPPGGRRLLLHDRALRGPEELHRHLLQRRGEVLGGLLQHHPLRRGHRGSGDHSRCGHGTHHAQGDEGRGIVRASILVPWAIPHRRLRHPVGLDLQPERCRQRDPGPARHVGLGGSERQDGHHHR